MSTIKLTASQMSLSIFVGDNYNYWDIKMKIYFLSQGHCDVVEMGTKTNDLEKEKN